MKSSNTNNNYKTMITQVKKYAKMESEEDIKQFELMVWKLAETQNSQVLKELLTLFDDNCEFPEIMYSLIHAIEQYPNEIYIKTILLNIKELKKSISWLTILIYRVLNCNESLSVLKQNIYYANKSVLCEILDIIANESEIHKNEVLNIKQQILKV